jgi:hypothetical protein
VVHGARNVVGIFLEGETIAIHLRFRRSVDVDVVSFPFSLLISFGLACALAPVDSFRVGI